ncbi:unnamed protein product [Linum trigynum]|uniref:F-box domain-containing protein n=1 Tax=Linum trigynum TaxID=586398 RepID=A0AAV2EGT2_9ROSI
MASSKYSKKTPKTSRANSSVRAIDRVSHLPNNILHHILSFLDTESTVQTSILSRRWRCLWKDVPVLNFSRNSSFLDKSDFQKHVDKFLSLRFESTAVSSISFDFGGEALRGQSAGKEIFESVMQYIAAAQGRISHVFISKTSHAADIRDMASAMVEHNLHGSLETLKLHKSNLKNSLLGYGPGFKLLTTLELQQCAFFSSASGKLIDPFANLPTLYHLKVINCTTWGCLLKVSGPKLLDLEIHILVSQHLVYSTFELVEVSAPKLKSFYFRAGNKKSTEKLPELNLPLLDNACIRLWWTKQKHDHPLDNETAERHNHECMNLFCGLHNAKSLVLRFDMVSN